MAIPDTFDYENPQLYIYGVGLIDCRDQENYTYVLDVYRDKSEILNAAKSAAIKDFDSRMSPHWKPKNPHSQLFSPLRWTAWNTSYSFWMKHYRCKTSPADEQVAASATDQGDAKGQSTLVECPHCQQRLRIPSRRHLLVTCSRCRNNFEIGKVEPYKLNSFKGDKKTLSGVKHRAKVGVKITMITRNLKGSNMPMPDELAGIPRTIRRVNNDGVDFFPYGLDGERSAKLIWPDEQKESFPSLIINPNGVFAGFVDDDTFIIDDMVSYTVYRFEDGKEVASAKKYDDIYRQARLCFDVAGAGREFDSTLLVVDWNETRDPLLASAFRDFTFLANEGYGKAYYPLSILHGCRDISVLLSQDQARRERRPTDTKYWSTQSQILFNTRSKEFAELAFKWCFSNKENFDPELWCDLGEMYLEGLGVADDEEQAAIWLHKAAEKGHARACLLYGMCCQDSPDMELKWLTHAADLGDANAQYWMAEFHCSNDVDAMKWYKSSAEHGHSSAQVEVASRYEEGRGVPQDISTAIQWYRQAADLGNATAQYRLGKCYAEGRGVPQDNAIAAQWFQKAIEVGPGGFAHFTLAECYQYGRGVNIDLEKAIELYRQAAYSCKDAIVRLQALE